MRFRPQIGLLTAAVWGAAAAGTGCATGGPAGQGAAGQGAAGPAGGPGGAAAGRADGRGPALAVTVPVGGGPAPLDRDFDGLVLDVLPRGIESVVRVNMAAARRSAWTRPVLDATPAAERARRTAARGFDDVEDIDALVLAGLTDSKGETATLVVAHGRFDTARVREAFLRLHDKAIEQEVLGRPFIEAGDEALVFLTDATIASGPPATVRAITDTAWGRLPAVRGDREIVDAWDASADSAGGSLVRIAVVMTDDVRARLRSELGLGNGPKTSPTGAAVDGLERLGVRIAAGDALDVAVVAVNRSADGARLLADEAASLIRVLRGRPALAELGLDDLLGRLRVESAGRRTLANLTVPGDARDKVIENLVRLAGLLAGAPSSGASPGVSW